MSSTQGGYISGVWICIERTVPVRLTLRHLDPVKSMGCRKIAINLLVGRINIKMYGMGRAGLKVCNIL